KPLDPVSGIAQIDMMHAVGLLGSSRRKDKSVAGSAGDVGKHAFRVDVLDMLGYLGAEHKVEAPDEKRPTKVALLRAGSHPGGHGGECVGARVEAEYLLAAPGQRGE